MPLAFRDLVVKFNWTMEIFTTYIDPIGNSRVGRSVKGKRLNRPGLQRWINRLIRNYKNNYTWDNITVRIDCDRELDIVLKLSMSRKLIYPVSFTVQRMDANYVHHNLYGPAWWTEIDGITTMEQWRVRGIQVPWMESLLADLDSWEKYLDSPGGLIVITELAKEGMLKIEKDALENLMAGISLACE